MKIQRPEAAASASAPVFNKSIISEFLYSKRVFCKAPCMCDLIQVIKENIKTALGYPGPKKKRKKTNDDEIISIKIL